ncbi:glycosyltransferase family 2 protein [Spirillospora sp. NBC_01491]|uniref:glycosyltransferase family 2 protein n=1 Tax=Spirillospora sp. NBC_01491 TaxID=2976007 RepID=UPI002E3224EE|nr:glycosyltransferase [Spirillospora sp. NBC_01491]
MGYTEYADICPTCRGARTGRRGDRTPRVSVIIPVYNCRPSLDRALRSVSDQTIGREAMEVIAVDDGSTDGGGAELDRWAREWPGLRVVHQPNSGGPGGPRNTGLDRAAGEYVFFLDADDHLGPEALERLCAMADANGTDVAIGRYVGVGRRAPRFERDVPRTTVLAADPPVYDSLSVLKLFRRSLIERLGLRFPTEQLSAEDHLFTARALFAADGISVVGEYECYYWIDRENGTSVLQQGGADAARHLARIGEVMEFVAGEVPAGPDRDRLMARHFLNEIFSRFGRRYPGLDPLEQAATRDGARGLFEAWWTDGVGARFGARGHLIAHCVTHRLDGLLTRVVESGLDGPAPEVRVEGARVFQHYPGFRDPEYAVPDARYEITHRVRQRRRLDAVEWRQDRLRVRGYAFLTEIGADGQSAHLVLRERDGAAEYRVPFEVTAWEGELPEMAADIDLASVAGGGPLPAGHWDIAAVMTAGGIVREGPLYPGKGAAVQAPGVRIVPVKGGTPYVTPYFDGEAGPLALRCGGLGGGPAPVTTDAAAMTPGPALDLALSVRTAVTTEITVAALLRQRGGETVIEIPLPARWTVDGVVATGQMPLTALAPGRWDLWQRITVAGSADERRVQAPAHLPDTGRGIQPYATEKGNLSLLVAPPRNSGLLQRLKIVRG